MEEIRDGISPVDVDKMVSNTFVSGLGFSIAASGFPKQAAKHDGYEFAKKVLAIESFVEDGDYLEHPDVRRAINLASFGVGQGHDNFLRGIRVHMNITASQVWWQQCGRYAFFDIVSSQSKMHRIRHILDSEGYSAFHDRVWGNVWETLEWSYKDAKDEADVENMTDIELAYNCPGGLLLTAGCSTNYLQLKTQYHQRKHHKLPEWQTYCAWIKTLPMAEYFITQEAGK